VKKIILISLTIFIIQLFSIDEIYHGGIYDGYTSNSGDFVLVEHPLNINILIEEDFVILTWDNNENAQYYNVYSSIDPYSDNWILEETGTLLIESTWNEELTTERKYYIVTAITD